MRKFLSWLATAATLSFSVPIQASQNDPRLPQLFEQLKEARTAEEAGLLERAIWQRYHFRQVRRVTIVDPNRIGLHCLHHGIIERMHMQRENVHATRPLFQSQENYNTRAQRYCTPDRPGGSHRQFPTTIAPAPGGRAECRSPSFAPRQAPARTA